MNLSSGQQYPYSNVLMYPYNIVLYDTHGSVHQHPIQLSINYNIPKTQNFNKKNKIRNTSLRCFETNINQIVIRLTN